MNHNAAATALGALGNPVRLEVYRSLVRAGQSGLTIGEVQVRLGGVPRSTLAHHLHKLVAAGLVTQQKDGSSVLSQANYAVMRDLIAFLTEKCCAEEGANCDTRESAA